MVCVTIPEGDLPEGSRTCPTGCDAGAGIVSAWERKKPEAEKMLDAKRQSPAPNARFD
jgi:hypothetical protein